MSQKHGAYGLIHQKSWDGIMPAIGATALEYGAYVDALLWALTSEPEEAADMGERLIEHGLTRRGLSFGGMQKLVSLGARTVTAGLETIATYLMTENQVATDRDKKMEQVYRFDHRLGLWADAAIVERAWGLTVGPPSSEDGRNIISCVRLLARSKTISRKQWRRIFVRGQKADVIGDAYNEELLRSESYLAENAHVLRVEKMVDETYGIGVIGTTAAMGVADVWWSMDPDQPDRDLDRDSTEWGESEARASKELEKAAFNAVLSYPWYDRQTP